MSGVGNQVARGHQNNCNCRISSCLAARKQLPSVAVLVICFVLSTSGRGLGSVTATCFCPAATNYRRYHCNSRPAEARSPSCSKNAGGGGGSAALERKQGRTCSISLQSLSGSRYSRRIQPARCRIARKPWSTLAAHSPSTIRHVYAKDWRSNIQHLGIQRPRVRCSLRQQQPSQR